MQDFFMLEEKADLGSEERRNLARPEGFEPPTLRSEVSPDPERPETGRKRSLIFQGFSLFGFRSLYLVSCSYGNKNGNIFGNSIEPPVRLLSTHLIHIPGRGHTDLNGKGISHLP